MLRMMLLYSIADYTPMRDTQGRFIPSWHNSLLCVGKCENPFKRGNCSKVGIFIVRKPSFFPCGNVQKASCDKCVWKLWQPSYRLDCHCCRKLASYDLIIFWWELTRRDSGWMASECATKLLRKAAAMAIYTNLTIDNSSALNNYVKNN